MANRGGGSGGSGSGCGGEGARSVATAWYLVHGGDSNWYVLPPTSLLYDLLTDHSMCNARLNR